MDFSGSSRSLQVTGFVYNEKVMRQDEEFTRLAEFGEDFFLPFDALEQMANSTVMKGIQIEHCDINNGMITQSAIVAPGLWMISGVLIDQGTCPSFRKAIDDVVAFGGPRGLSATHTIRDKRSLEVSICRDQLRPGCGFWIGGPSDIPDHTKEEVMRYYGPQIKKEWVEAFGFDPSLVSRQPAGIVQASRMTSVDTSPQEMVDVNPTKEETKEPVSVADAVVADIELNPSSPIPVDIQMVMKKWCKPGATITEEDRLALLKLVEQNRDTTQKVKQLIQERKQHTDDEGAKKKSELIHLLASSLSGDDKNPGLADALQKLIVENPESESANMVVRASQKFALKRARDAELRSRQASQEASEFMRRCSNLINPVTNAPQGIVRASRHAAKTVQLKPIEPVSASSASKIDAIEDRWAKMLKRSE